MAVDLDRAPAERAGTGGVGARVPSEHGLAALPEPVDVDDGDQVLEAGVAGAREGLPHGALGELAVAREHPYAVGDPVERLARERDADADGQPEPERAGGDVDPGQSRGGVAFEAAAELAVCGELLLVDRTGGAVHRVEQRRGVALGEDQMVVAGIVGPVEVVAQVASEQHGHEVGGGERRGRVARAGGRDHAHRRRRGAVGPARGWWGDRTWG
jgi:hypothetical protein